LFCFLKVRSEGERRNFYELNISKTRVADMMSDSGAFLCVTRNVNRFENITTARLKKSGESLMLVKKEAGWLALGVITKITLPPPPPSKDCFRLLIERQEGSA